jgi:hypothetical protein
VLPHSYEFVDPHNWVSIIFVNELADSREDRFVAAVVVELGKKIMKANLGEGPKVSIIQLNLSNRSVKNATTLSLSSEFDGRPCLLKKWFYPSSFFGVTRQPGLKGFDYPEVFECLEESFRSCILSDWKMMRLPGAFNKDEFSQLSGAAVLDFEINFYLANWVPRAEFLTAPSSASPVERVYVVVVCSASNAVPFSKETFRATSG